MRQFFSTLRLFIIGLLDAVDEADHLKFLGVTAKEQFDLGYQAGKVQGRREAPTRFGVLPLPLTAEQLRGMEYGDFITLSGDFAIQFGEQTIPAPGQHGYEQRGYYVNRDDLLQSTNTHDLHCHAKHKFNDPDNADMLVPVIVTVLR